MKREVLCTTTRTRRKNHRIRKQKGNENNEANKIYTRMKIFYNQLSFEPLLFTVSRCFFDVELVEVVRFKWLLLLDD